MHSHAVTWVVEILQNQIVEVRALKRTHQHNATKFALAGDVEQTRSFTWMVDHLNRRVKDLQEAIKVIKATKQ